MNERDKELWSKAAEATKNDSWDEQVLFMQRFADLIRADEREACATRENAYVQAEREACAKVCEDFEVPTQINGAHPDYLVGKEMAATQLAHAIRARGAK